MTHHAISKLTCYIRVTAVALLGDMPDMDGHWLMPRRAGTGPLLSRPCRHRANSRPVLVHHGSPLGCASKNYRLYPVVYHPEARESIKISFLVVSLSFGRDVL